MISYVDDDPTQEIRSTVLVPQFKYYVFDDNNLYKKFNINQIEKNIKEMRQNQKLKKCSKKLKKILKKLPQKKY